MSNTFTALQPKYAELLDKVKVKASWKVAANNAANRIFANRMTYQAVTDETGVPWEFIGIIHMLEGGLNFHTHLHNGNTLNHRTTDVPKGRPEADPLEGIGHPYGWKESAIDALKLKKLDEVKDWSDERILYEWERYNGFGYRNQHPGTLSPYLWSGTNLYTRGKYIRDGQWSETAVSKQTGCYAILVALRTLQSNQEVKVAVDGSKKITILNRVRNAVSTTAATYFTVDYFQLAKQYMYDLKEFMSDHAALLLLGGIGGFLIINEIIKHMSVNDYKAGRWVPSGLAQANEIDKTKIGDPDA